MNRTAIIERAKGIANSPFNIAYISRQSSEYVRQSVRELLGIIQEMEAKKDMARNRITIGAQESGCAIGLLENGTMFRLESPTREDTVYMKTDASGHNTSTITCILLANGGSYEYDYRKVVYPIRQNQSVTITQG